MSVLVLCGCFSPQRASQLHVLIEEAREGNRDLLWHSWPCAWEELVIQCHVLAPSQGGLDLNCFRPQPRYIQLS